MNIFMMSIFLLMIVKLELILEKEGTMALFWLVGCSFFQIMMCLYAYKIDTMCK